MIEVIFLLSLAIIWLVFASVQDLKYREVANWLNFSLIIFALGFRFFYSLFLGDFNLLYQGLIGLGIFFIIGNLLYYGRMFAGGDAKLMIALGAILPISSSFTTNLNIFVVFFLLFLFVGGLYGLGWSVVLPFRNLKNYKKDFSKLFFKNKKIISVMTFFGILSMLFSLLDFTFFLLGIFIFILPYLYLHAKSVDESCLVKKIKTKHLVEGDWLYKDLRIGNKVIKAKWEGLNNSQIKTIRSKQKEILIRHGIPFVPVFLISFLFLFYFYLFEPSFIESVVRGFAF